MKQSRAMSLVEAITNVAVGYGVAVVTTMMVMSVLGLEVTLSQNMTMAAVFTAVSIARSFVLRRFFEEIRSHQASRASIVGAGPPAREKS